MTGGPQSWRTRRSLLLARCVSVTQLASRRRRFLHRTLRFERTPLRRFPSVHPVRCQQADCSAEGCQAALLRPSSWFLTTSTVCSAPGVVGLLHPTSDHGVHLVGGTVPTAGLSFGSLSADALPFSEFPQPAARASRHREPLPPRRCTPHARPTSRPYSADRSVTSHTVAGVRGSCRSWASPCEALRGLRRDHRAPRRRSLHRSPREPCTVCSLESRRGHLLRKEDDAVGLLRRGCAVRDVRSFVYPVASKERSEAPSLGPQAHLTGGHPCHESWSDTLPVRLLPSRHSLPNIAGDAWLSASPRRHWAVTDERSPPHVVPTIPADQP